MTVAGPLSRRSGGRRVCTQDPLAKRHNRHTIARSPRDPRATIARHHARASATMRASLTIASAGADGSAPQASKLRTGARALSGEEEGA